MKNLLYILIFLCSFANGFSQGDLKDTIWFDGNWEKCQKPQAKIFRVFQKEKIGYIVFDKYLNGKLQMSTIASEYDPLVKEGEAIFYNELGYKTKKAIYKKNNVEGREVLYFDNEKDSSIYEYYSGSRNAESKCIRKSLLEPDPVYTVVEEMPEYVGGMNALIKFLQENITYPKKMNRNSCGGKVFVRFVVTSSGAITEVNAFKSSGFDELDEEAIRVVKAMPAWIPGKQKGDAVPVYFNLPVNFTISDPFFVFNVNNKNQKYIDSKSTLLSGNYNYIIDKMEEIVKEDPTDSDAIFNLGVAYKLNGKKKKGCEYLKKAEELKHWLAEKKYSEWCN